MYSLPWVIGLPRHRRSQLDESAFPVFVRDHRNLCKIESKFLNSRVLAGGFVLDVQKSLGFKHILKSTRKVCSITKEFEISDLSLEVGTPAHA